MKVLLAVDGSSCSADHNPSHHHRGSRAVGSEPDCRGRTRISGL